MSTPLDSKSSFDFWSRHEKYVLIMIFLQWFSRLLLSNGFFHRIGTANLHHSLLTIKAENKSLLISRFEIKSCTHSVGKGKAIFVIRLFFDHKKKFAMFKI